MKTLIGLVVISIALALASVNASQASQENACADLLTGDQAGIDYQGHCVLVEPEKGPVQGIWVATTENLDGVTKECIVIIHTATGWKLADDTCVVDGTDTTYATVAVTDGWHMALDPTE